MFSRIAPFSGFRKEISVEGVEFFNGRYTKENGKKDYVTEHPKIKLC